MDISEAPFHHLLFPLRPPCFLLSPHKLSSSYLCHHIHLGCVFGFALCLANRCTRTRPVMASKKGLSATAMPGAVCEILWSVEAKLAPGQILYVTGDPIALGSWQPEMAIPMLPTEQANIWKAEIKIPSGVNFKYNYFIKEENWSSTDIIWRNGSEFCMSIPRAVKKDEKVIVRDSWTEPSDEGSPVHGWNSWIEEPFLPVQPLSAAPIRDEYESVKSLEIDTKETGSFQFGLALEDELCSSDEDRDVGRFDSSILADAELDQTVEEPWLLHHSVNFFSFKDMITDVPKSDGTEGDNTTEFDVSGESIKKDQLLSTHESNLIWKGDSVSTVILINSSICTMQRIAVLEDGKLVELLLEPVKSNVQCDSVYLGVVTKLVPHMGGAFVNIGTARPSLMDIRPNREPFIFHPFRRKIKKGGANDSGDEGPEDHFSASDEDDISPDVEAIIDDASDFITQDELFPLMHVDQEDNEVDDDFDILEVLGMVNGGAVDGGVQADNGNFLGSVHHLEGETVNGSPQSIEDAEHVSNDRNKWIPVRKGTKIIVQVVKEGLGSKGPTLTAYPKLRSRLWVLSTRCDRIGISKKISGVERTRLRVIAKSLQPPGFGLTVRTVAAGQSLEELQKDLEGLLSTWKDIMEHAKAAALAADEGVGGAVPVILHRALGQTLSVVQDYFNEKVEKMLVDSPRIYHEVTNYLQDIAPNLCDRVELYDKRSPLFDEFNLEEEIDNILSKRVPLANGGSLVIEQTEALVSIDVNGGHVMFGHDTSQEKAILDVNLAAAKQIARELRLRDIGGIIVVDFIDMADDSNKRLVYEEMKRAVERDRSTVKVSELSKHGLMEITRKRVRPSVTFMISEPCTCCHATGRIEALETSFSKIEQEICRLLATIDQEADPENPKSWPKFILRVDHQMCNYLTSGKRTRLAMLSSSLKVWILLKVARGFTRGTFEVKPFIDDKVSKRQNQVVAISVLRKTETISTDSGRKVTLLPVKKEKTRTK